jgi:hypothetical protein
MAIALVRIANYNPPDSDAVTPFWQHQLTSFRFSADGDIVLVNEAIASR